MQLVALVGLSASAALGQTTPRATPEEEAARQNEITVMTPAGAVTVPPANMPPGAQPVHPPGTPAPGQAGLRGVGPGVGPGVGRPGAAGQPGFSPWPVPGRPGPTAGMPMPAGSGAAGARPMNPMMSPGAAGFQAGMTGQPGDGSGAALAEGDGQSRPELPMPEPGSDEISLASFTEPIELKTLIEYVAEVLQINVVASDAVSGSVVFNAPLTVKYDDLLEILATLLEQQGFTVIVDDRTGIYRVVPVENVGVSFTGLRATTRIIATPNLRPSSLNEMMIQQLGLGDPRVGRVTFNDDLGVIIVTASPRQLSIIEGFVRAIVEQYGRLEYFRFDLQHLAASVARERLVTLVGQGDSGLSMQVGGAIQAVPRSSLSNFSERLLVDPQSNSMVLRGLAGEADLIRRLLPIVDVQSNLEPRKYFAGSAASQIASIARSQGLGLTKEIQTEAASGAGALGVQLQQQGGLQMGAAGGTQGGPTMIVDTSRGEILYYATASQHDQLDRLIRQYDTERDIVTIRAYKLENTKAIDISEIVQGLISNQQTAARSDLLPAAERRRRGDTRDRQPQTTPRPVIQPLPGGGNRPAPPGGSPDDVLGSINPEDVFVLADEQNNQVLVKAPGKLQTELAQLIRRLDLRRAQVFLEVQIVSVTANDDFRLAFETQLINADGTGGVVNTNFGLGSFGTTGQLTNRKTVATGLAGITAAIIKSDQVPIVINALKREADTRIVSSPQLLVDDNEEAEIVTLEQQPTTTTQQQTGVPTTTSFGGFEDAGTQLSVKPSISGTDYLRLDYSIELSNFVGTGSGGLPPPRQKREVNSTSVTIPSDSTIVVGGITVSEKGKTVAKVPLLGDIPLIGLLFSDTGTRDNSTRLYVFITPRILRDTNFRDLLLLTRGPTVEAGLALDLPPLPPSRIDIITSEPRGEPSAAGGFDASPAGDRRRLPPPEPSSPASPSSPPATAPPASAPPGRRPESPY